MRIAKNEIDLSFTEFQYTDEPRGRAKFKSKTRAYMVNDRIWISGTKWIVLEIEEEWVHLSSWNASNHSIGKEISFFERPYSEKSSNRT